MSSFWGPLQGVDYWPSPERSEFLKESIFERQDGFVRTLKKLVDENLSDMIQQATEFLHYPKNKLLFPGFGTTILANCDSRSTILDTALEFRNTNECKAFRSWLQEMDYASRVGNIRIIANNLEELDSIILSFRRSLGIDSSPQGNMELEIGLSPSLTLDLKSVKSFLKSAKPKSLNLVFLQNHFHRVLENANLWHQIWRLFPELKLSSWPRR